MKIKPIFLYAKRFPPFKFTGITFLIFVITKMTYDKTTGTYTKPVLSDRYKRHETWHVWQQLCLFALGIFTAVFGRLFGASGWIYLLPVLLPFAAYVACWIVELILPPYKTAYKDICFEGEALYNERNKNPKYYPFSFLYYIPNKDWKRLGEENFPD